LDALLGSFPPSMANISRPISPCWLQIATPAAKTRAISGPLVPTKCARVVKCRAVSPQSAMKVTCSRQSRSIPRLLTTPYAEAQSTTFRSNAGGYAGAPVGSFRKRVSKLERSMA
jgi:hypothetical protein